jgi:oligoendopeptidase F
LTARSAADEGLGQLPTWNLSDLYSGPDSPALAADLDAGAGKARAFRERYAGRLADLEGAGLGAAIAEYEAIQEVLGRVMSFAQLVYSGDMSDPKVARFFQSMQERCTTISTDLVFFTLELNRLDDATLEAKMKAPELARYAPWLRDLRAMRPHQLADDIERLLHEKYVAGRAAWTRLFDETMAGLRFPFRGEALTSAEILNRLTERDRRRGGRRRSRLARCWARTPGSSP